MTCVAVAATAAAPMQLESRDRSGALAARAAASYVSTAARYARGGQRCASMCASEAGARVARRSAARDEKTNSKLEATK